MTSTQEMELATLHAVADNLVALTSSRDELVLRLHREGVSLRVIAEAAGMSHVGVKKMVERLTSSGEWVSK